MTMMEKLNRPLLKEYAGAIAIVLGALPALTGMVISILSSYRGEPEAQKAYTSLSGEVNKVHDWMNAINLELARHRGREEGAAFAQQAVILEKLEALKAENEQLKRNAKPAPPPPPPTVEGTIGLGSPGTIGHGAGFGSGAGRLGGSRPKAAAARPPRPIPAPDVAALIDVPAHAEAPPAAAEAPPQNYQQQQPLKVLPALEKLPEKLDDL
jgi:hypothetical protein